ncbi:MAG: hypothetical protein RR930_06085 [Clostridium sp.]
MKKGRKAAVAGILISMVITATAFGGNQEADLVTLAGIPGIDLINGSGQFARFAQPAGIDVSNDIVVIADTYNNCIRSYERDKTSTRAGYSPGRDAYGFALGGYRDGTGRQVLFNRPADCVYRKNGQIVVADRENHSIRIIGNTYTYTLNGTGQEGYREGKGTIKAMFSRPSGIAQDAYGTIYVADTGNHCIRKITSEGNTALIAGVPGKGGFLDGAWNEALFMEPSSVAVAKDGTIYVADMGNQRIRKIANGQVTTLSGAGEGTYLDTEYKIPGFADGSGNEALFRFPQGICMAKDVVLVADTGNHVIRAISPLGTTKVIAGSGEPGYKDGTAQEAELNMPEDVAWNDNVLYVMDSGNSSLRIMDFNPKEWLEEVGEGKSEK